MKEGWVQDEKNWYYLNNTTGEMATGWAETDGKWYFLDNSGCMQTGVIEVNGKIYALDENNGSMRTGTILLSDRPGETYTFDPITGEAVGSKIPVPTKAYSAGGGETGRSFCSSKRTDPADAAETVGRRT